MKTTGQSTYVLDVTLRELRADNAEYKARLYKIVRRGSWAEMQEFLQSLWNYGAGPSQTVWNNNGVAIGHERYCAHPGAHSLSRGCGIDPDAPGSYNQGPDQGGSGNVSIAWLKDNARIETVELGRILREFRPEVDRALLGR